MWYAVVLVVSLALSYYMSVRAMKKTSLSPGEVSPPTVNQGDRFSKLFGTRYIKAPKVVWMGEVTTEPIQK